MQCESQGMLHESEMLNLFLVCDSGHTDVMR